VYADDHLSLTEALTLVAGGRVEYARESVTGANFAQDGDRTGAQNFTAFNPRVGFLYQLTPAVQLFGNASRAYEPPALLEATSPENLMGGLGDLKAQKAWQFELGTRGSWGERLEWDLSVYDMELWDEIQNVNVVPFPGAPFTIPRFRNVDRSRHAGIEFGGEWTFVRGVARALGLSAGDDALSLRTQYTWSKFKFVDDPRFGNNQLPGAPEHYLEAELRYRHASGIYVMPNMQSVPAGYYVDSANTAKAPPYALAGLRLGYDCEAWKARLFFEARNLADSRWVSAVVTDSGNRRFFNPGDGRAFYGGASWSW
jgi:iron complex outermembrane receptor protein